MPTAIVTGGAGFIGSHVAERFLREGWTCTSIDNLVDGQAREPSRGRDASTSWTFAIRRPRSSIASTKPDVLVHLAAQMDVRSSVDDPVYDASVEHRSARSTCSRRCATRSPKTRVRVRVHGRRALRRQHDAAQRRGLHEGSRVAVRDREAHGGALPRVLRPRPQARRRRAALRQRLRTAAGSARRGGRRRDLLRPHPRGQAAHGLRRRARRRATTCTSATWREAMWRGATRPLPPVGAARRARVQHRHRHRHVGRATCADVLLEDAGTTVPHRVRAERAGRAAGVVRRHRQGRACSAGSRRCRSRRAWRRAFAGSRRDRQRGDGRRLRA